jgi:serine protease Do
MARKIGFAVALVVGGTLAVGEELPTMTAGQVFEFVRPSIVLVEVVKKKTSKRKAGSGTGVIVRGGDILTNCHVIKDAKKITVSQEQTKLSAVPTEDSSYKDDICFVRPVAPIGVPVTYAQKKAAVGDTVYAVGHPLAMGVSITSGIVSAWQRDKWGSMLQHTAAVTHGSSGGGLFDARGQLVGITTYFDTEQRGINWAMRTDMSDDK